MKYLSKIFIIFSLIFLSHCIRTKRNCNKGNKGYATIGESTNDKDSDSSDAITHSIGGNLRGPTIFDKAYTTPEYIEKISPIEQLNDRVVKTAEEVPTIINFYDGSQNLNKIDVNCKIFTSPSACYMQSYCGWCGQTAGCIRGTLSGPMEDCEVGTYNFNLGQ